MAPRGSRRQLFVGLLLGKGTFGSVFEGAVMGVGTRVAVKRFHDGDHLHLLLAQLKQTLAALRAARSWVGAGCRLLPARAVANKVWSGELLVMPLYRQQATHAPEAELTECLRVFCDELDRVGVVHVDLCRRNILWSGTAWVVIDFDAAYVVATAPEMEPPRGSLDPFGEGHGYKMWHPAACRCAMRFAACATVARYVPRGGSYTRKQFFDHYDAVAHVGLCPPQLAEEAAAVFWPESSSSAIAASRAGFHS